MSAPTGSTKDDRAASPTGGSQLPPLPIISHELQTLVEGVQRSIRSARTALLKGSEARRSASPSPDALTRLDEATMTLERLTLLAEAVAAGKPNIVEACSIIEAIQQTVLAAHAFALERDVRLRVECSPRLILTPAGPIGAAVASALHNAIEAVEAGGEVELIVELATPPSGAPRVEIDILDTGAGPPEGAGERVFELGFTTRSPAAGVGLSLAKAIVDELAGRIALARRSDGKPGAHLRITYPAASADAYAKT